MKIRGPADISLPRTNASSPQTGLVLSHLGKSLAVEAEDGTARVCHTRRQLGTVAVGDRVLWTACGDGQGRVEEILPRRNLLTRPAHNGQIRPVAANLDRVLVVIAPEPQPDWLLADQILAICAARDIAAALLLNKTDLPFPGSMTEELAVYRAAGYTLHRISTVSGEGVEALGALLGQGVSLFAGQSGVGKSSLTRRFQPKQDIQVGALSTGSGHGRHTTTAATLYRLPEGGCLIDSPGVAIFGLANLTPGQLASGFVEFRPHLGRCRFNDCRHTDEPGCAVRTAVESGQIDARRHRRYVRLLDMLPRPAWQSARP
jgi:ribosome biogenesis GTPase